jgi:hypothetical protein
METEFEKQAREDSEEYQQECAEALALLGLLRPEMSDFEIYMLGSKIYDDPQIEKIRNQISEESDEPGILAASQVDAIRRMSIFEIRALAARL